MKPATASARIHRHGFDLLRDVLNVGIRSKMVSQNLTSSGRHRLRLQQVHYAVPDLGIVLHRRDVGLIGSRRRDHIDHFFNDIDVRRVHPTIGIRIRMGRIVYHPFGTGIARNAGN
jgi:hypothetical protein